MHIRKTASAARWLLPLFLAMGFASSLPADTADTPSLLPPKPKWLTELSVSVKESYDNNVFLAGAPRSLLGVYTIVPGSVAALDHKASWITTISPKISLELAPLLSTTDVLRSLTLGYAPEFAHFAQAQSEDYSAHRLSTGIKLQCGDLSLVADNLFTYVDGSDYAPSYPKSLYNAWVQTTVRERREQTQDRANLAVKYDQPDWFVRGVGSLQNYNLLTHQLPAGTGGYLSYPDRYDVNVGADIGYKVVTNFAFTIGYRVGKQHQDTFPASVDIYGQTSSSDYQRLLFGFEGRPCSWLTAKFQAGPDFRNYSDSAPVRSENPVTFYGEGSLEAKASAKDTVTLKFKQWRWVSSTGKVPDDELSLDLNYTRKLTSELSLLLGARALQADYRGGLKYSAGHDTPATAPANERNDWDYIGSIAFALCVHRECHRGAGIYARSGKRWPERSSLG